jgi:hypothetical protein
MHSGGRATSGEPRCGEIKTRFPAPTERIAQQWPSACSDADGAGAVGDSPFLRFRVRSSRDSRLLTSAFCILHSVLFLRRLPNFTPLTT